MLHFRNADFGLKNDPFPQLGHNINLLYEPKTVTFLNPCQNIQFQKM